MKNIFLVINKEKLYAYVVSILTICTLFFMSGMMDKDFDRTKTTSSNLTENVIEENIVENKDVTNNSIVQNTVNKNIEVDNKDAQNTSVQSTEEDNTEENIDTSGGTINIIL